MTRTRAWGAVSVLGLWAAAVASVHCTGEDIPPDTAQPSNEAGAADGATAQDGATGGDGATDAAAAPLLTDAVTIAAGRAHTCAVTAAQDVLCWGSNASGQLGVAPAQVARSSRPVKVDLGGKASLAPRAIAAGANHTCVVMTDGKIKCWGNNERAQLGRGTLVATGGVDVVSPPSQDAYKPLWTEAEVVTAGAAFTCAGVKIASSSLGLPDRRFFCWGENIARQSGTESTNGQPVTTPWLVSQDGKGGTAPPFEGFAVAAGDDFACGGIYYAAGAAFGTTVGCWGSRVDGRIGSPPVNGFEVNPTLWPRYPADAGGSLVQGLAQEGLLASGAAHTCARYVTPNPQQLLCWGSNTKGQTGSAAVGPKLIEAMVGFDAASVTALAAGGETTCIIASGQAQCIGGNDVGQLGRGTNDTNVNATFASVDLPPSASAIAVGQAHACAVLGTAPGQKGTVACWGQNGSGQLGDGLDVDAGYEGATEPLKRVRTRPVRVLAPL